ncbi:MAG: sodium:alanine symporter family protein, partial [Clostridia bacterium]|nr:sodium:alanine symporter family protein [Clostridia bacterium]
RHGLSKGVFSHEAGMGTDPMLAASTDQEDFHVQGLISMLGPFLDTVVFCSLTALVVLVHNGVESDPSLVTRAAFSGFFPVCGGWAVDAVLLLLVLATLSSWAFYGEACVFYLSKRPVWKVLYRVIYCIVPLISAGADLSGLIVLGDGATAFMAVPNVVLCLLFICEVKSTKESRFIGTSNIDKIL